MNSQYITSYIKTLMPVEEFDTEKFILEVQKRECIWNVNSKSYNLKCIRNRETKKQAWEEIGRIFYPNWDSLTLEDQQREVEGLSRKWANIKKYYTDEVRKPANSPPKKRQRRYHHLLKFLDDSVHKKRVPRINEFKNISKEEINMDSSSDSEFGVLCIVEDDEDVKHVLPQRGNPPITHAVLDNKNNPDLYLDGSHKVENPFNLWENAVTLPETYNQNKITNTKIIEKNPEIIKLLNKARSPPPVHNISWHHPVGRPVENNKMPETISFDQAAEASKRFLLSLLPEVMSLNVKQNLQFRLGIIDLLNDIKSRVNPNLNPKLFPNINID